MKKIILATAMVASMCAAQAIEVGVSVVRDMTLEQNATRITASGVTMKSFTPEFSASVMKNVYTRYAVGGHYDVTKVGPVALAATGSVGYQASATKGDGYGATLGLAASMPVAKNATFSLGAERRYNQSVIVGSDGNTVVAGLSVKF
jgi:hypothetical protein